MDDCPEIEHVPDSLDCACRPCSEAREKRRQVIYKMLLSISLTKPKDDKKS